MKFSILHAIESCLMCSFGRSHSSGLYTASLQRTATLLNNLRHSKGSPEPLTKVTSTTPSAMTLTSMFPLNWQALSSRVLTLIVHSVACAAGRGQLGVGTPKRLNASRSSGNKRLRDQSEKNLVKLWAGRMSRNLRAICVLLIGTHGVIVN